MYYPVTKCIKMKACLLVPALRRLMDANVFEFSGSPHVMSLLDGAAADAEKNLDKFG